MCPQGAGVSVPGAQQRHPPWPWVQCAKGRARGLTLRGPQTTEGGANLLTPWDRGQGRPKDSLWPLPPALMRHTWGEGGERSLQLPDLVLFLFCFEKFLVVYLRETGREMLPECLSFSRSSFP